MAPLPTPTAIFQTLNHPSPVLPLQPRQATITATPSNSNNSSPTDAKTLSGGAIAGIVIGSIAGFLILLWIIRSCTNLGAPPGEAVPGRPWYGSVRGEAPPREVYEGRRSRSRSRGREGYYSHGHGHHGHGHHHHHGGHRHRSGSRRGEFAGPVVQEVVPAVVVRDEAGRRRSRSRGYYGEGYEYRESGRSRSRGGY